MKIESGVVDKWRILSLKAYVCVLFVLLQCDASSFVWVGLWSVVGL